MHITQVAKHLLPCIFLFLIPLVYTTDNTNPYLKRYSRVNFNKNELIKSHERIKRGTDRYINLKFEAHDKNFDIKIKPSESKHFETTHVEFATSQVAISDFQVYEGFLVDEPEDSHVSGTIIDGAFIGTITSKKSGTFYIEPAKKYGHSDSHSVIFHENDVELNPKRNESETKVDFDSHLGCGTTDSSVRDALEKEQAKIFNPIENKKVIQEDNYAESESFKYSKEANSRNKRQTQTFPDGRTVCNMYLKVDPFLYDTIYNKEGNKNDVLTQNYLIYFLNKQVESLNNIFRSISSSSSQYFQTFTFKIYRAKIYRFSDCESLSTEEKKICENFLDSLTFLNYVSLDNSSDYCLSYTFTSRDFTGGVLGLAWLASTNGQVGGICEKPATDSTGTKYRNTGIVTLVSYGARVNEVISQITFAHEVGHSLGSNHDPNSCSPGGSQGNYVMFSRATTGTLENNRKFSSCSIGEMNKVLANLLATSKNCLRVSNEAICGNGIIETGEVCDTGKPEGGQCCDRCRTRKGECDPSEGPCCDPNSCSFYRDSRICLANDDCRQDIKCLGTSALCPIDQSVFFKPDLSLCNSQTQVCRNGVCTDSICDKFGMKQCYFEANLNDTKVDKSTLCYLSCNGSQTGNQCKFTKDIVDFGGRSYSLRPGSACSGMQGYCDLFSKCRSVSAEGYLAKLVKSLLAPKLITTEDLKDWAIEYWYVILICSIVFIAINGFILFCIWEHIQSDNPEMRPGLSFIETLKNPLNVCKRRPKNNDFTKFSRDTKTKRVTREVVPRIHNDDSRSSDSSDFNLQTISQPRKIAKIRKNPRQMDD